MSRRTVLYRKKLLQVGQVRVMNASGGVQARDLRLPKDVAEGVARIVRLNGWPIKAAKRQRIVARFS